MNAKRLSLTATGLLISTCMWAQSTGADSRRDRTIDQSMPATTAQEIERKMNRPGEKQNLTGYLLDASCANLGASAMTDVATRQATMTGVRDAVNMQSGMPRATTGSGTMPPSTTAAAAPTAGMPPTTEQAAAGASQGSNPNATNQPVTGETSSTGRDRTNRPMNDRTDNMSVRSNQARRSSSTAGSTDTNPDHASMPAGSAMGSRNSSRSGSLTEAALDANTASPNMASDRAAMEANRTTPMSLTQSGTKAAAPMNQMSSSASVGVPAGCAATTNTTRFAVMSNGQVMRFDNESNTNLIGQIQGNDRFRDALNKNDRASDHLTVTLNGKVDGDTVHVYSIRRGK